jgi:glycosyltransferase involved in cell wall biosynthesis
MVSQGREISTPRLRVGYVYRHFNNDGSLSSLFRRRAERLARDEDVTVLSSRKSRADTTAPIRFETVEPLVVGDNRLSYAVECGTFEVRATRRLRALRSQLDVITVDGFAASVADIAVVHAVRRAEIDHYFERIEPTASVRRRLTPLVRPQTAVVLSVERRLFRPPYPLCLAVSRKVEEDLRRHHGVPADLIEVLPYGLELDMFRFDAEARARERLANGIDDERVVLLFVGDDFGRKGLERAIRALPLAGSSVELWVVGGGDVPTFQGIARSAGVGERTRFFGKADVQEVARLYSAADVLVLPSRQDAWGQPTLEAMAAGRIAVVSEFTGASEAIEDGVNGYVLDKSGSSDQLAALINGPLSDRELRLSIGARALTTASSYDAESIYARFRAAHHRAASRRAASGRERS